MPVIPMITKEQFGGRTSMDLFSMLLEERIIMLCGEINQDMASLLVSEILYLSAKDEKTPITIYIHSPGGAVHAGLAIFDIMKKVPNPIITIGMGLCASMAAFLLASGDKRYALENTEIMIHQPLGGSEGQVSDMEITIKRLIYLKEKLNKILAKATKKDLNQINMDTDRDYFLSAEEAKDYGLIDEVLYSSKG
ncbi:aTP-dependent Clp protease proteolytic subunit [Coprobacillus sp. CAG:826]|mgnify:FL=1|nr:ATP-dependent Clp protease proteolytic subunit [Coprobacillus sp.]CDD91657.1 aTP-dependent Clp protease proteolytic subunit [Coprobacillus sp. CAG:826]